MPLLYHALAAVSIGLFLFYGFSCLFSEGMVDEFQRFGLSRYRRLTGALEMLGAIGLAVGFVIPEIAVFSADGLTLLMILGTAARLRVRDTVVDMLPAVFLGIVNAWMAWSLL